jgi:hypothetical protein
MTRSSRLRAPKKKRWNENSPMILTGNDRATAPKTTARLGTQKAWPVKSMARKKHGT